MKKGKTFGILTSVLLLATTMASCGTKANGVSLSKSKPLYQTEDHFDNYVDDTYKNYYQILVYSYFDGNGDGIGDLKGLTEKLDYIKDGQKFSKTSLGYDGIYLLPIFPSPTYHKYDATDYYSVDSSYGTLEDFDTLVEEANRRGIDIILDLAVNHTSDQHPWFTKACSDLRNVTDFDPETGEPTEEAKNLYPSLRYYHFNHRTKLQSGCNWHSVSGTDWYYEGQFNSGMPDLNLSEDVVLDEIKNIMDFWLQRGVRGFRLDAVEHYFDWNKPKNYETLNKLADFGKELTQGREKDCFLVAEGPWSNTVSTYYENTHDISYMNFNYGSGGQGKLATAMTNAYLYNKKIDDLNAKKEEIQFSVPDGSIQFNIVNNGADVRCAADYFKNIVQNWDELLYSANPDAVDSNFGVNHDTIRAVNQLAGKFSDKELLVANKFYWGLNNTLTGVTFNYYGEEIGMKAGDQSVEANKDPNKRHPMYWSDSNTAGMTNYAPGATPTEQYYAPADKQIKDSNSLWNFMRELNLAKTYLPEIARGKQSFVKTSYNYLVMCKEYEGNKVYLLYNFSNKANAISKDELGIDGEPTEIRFSLSSSSSYYAKLTAETINVPAYSITMFI